MGPAPGGGVEVGSGGGQGSGCAWEPGGGDSTGWEAGPALRALHDLCAESFTREFIPRVCCLHSPAPNFAETRTSELGAVLSRDMCSLQELGAAGQVAAPMSLPR